MCTAIGHLCRSGELPPAKLWPILCADRDQQRQDAGNQLSGCANFVFTVVFWSCAENSVDNIGMVLLLLSSAYTVSFLLLLTPTKELGETQLGHVTASD